MKKLMELIFILMAFLSCQKEAVLGSRENPVKIYFTPSVDGGVISANSDIFIKYLEKETGLFFKTGIPTNYIAVVEAFGSNRADIGVMNSFGYLMAHSKYGALAKLKTIRYGRDYYAGQIITHIDNGIKSIADLAGKKFAFTDPTSTSGYMFPLKILKEAKVTLGNTVFAIKHDNVVSMVYQKQVDAGATFYSAPTADGKIRDARERVLTQFPDVEEKVKILTITEKIPNDPFVFRKGLSAEITHKFIAALKKFISTEMGKTTFRNIYSVEGVIDGRDEDYNGLRNMIKTLNLETAKLIK